jgi:hypothetical protein
VTKTPQTYFDQAYLRTNLQSYKPIFNNIDPPDTIFPSDFIKKSEDFQRTVVYLRVLCYDLDWETFRELNRQLEGLVGSLLRVHRHQEQIMRGLVVRILQNPGFVTDVHQVGIHAPRSFGGGRNWNIVGGGVLEQVLPTLKPLGELLYPPRGDDLHPKNNQIALLLSNKKIYFHFRPKRVAGQFEAHLVVSFSGGTVRDVSGVVRSRRFDEPHGDTRTSQGCAQEVSGFVDQSRLDGRPHVLLHEGLANVLDDNLDRFSFALSQKIKPSRGERFGEEFKGQRHNDKPPSTCHQTCKVF